MAAGTKNARTSDDEGRARAAGRVSQPRGHRREGVRVLKDPAALRPLGRAAEQMIEERYSLEAVLPHHIRLYERAMQKRGTPRRVEPTPPLSEGAFPGQAGSATAITD